MLTLSIPGSECLFLHVILNKMKLKFITILVTGILISIQPISAADPNTPKPKLIVGIIVDQMRYDYITRYWSKFGDNGFKKLVNEGYNCTNTHFSYVPTLTGPGHASVYTGTTPTVHGIIANNWYSRIKKKRIYVTDDESVNTVGTSGAVGKMSPVNLIATTISDELRLASNLRSKVIGVAVKDRGSILPAGHSANGAYWYDMNTGNWVTSTWYMKTLPEWVNEFNGKNHSEKLINIPWVPLLPITEYTESTPDDTPYEGLYPGETKPVFPHNFTDRGSSKYSLIRYSPHGNVITKDFALAAMKGEQLGQDEFTDILAISFSSTDEIGHQFGTHSIETQDTYLRLDRDLADMIKEIETYAGKENVLFFLTADHAAIPNVQFLTDQKIPSGIFNIAATTDSLKRYMSAKYGDHKWILDVYNDQVYFDHELLKQKNIKLDDVISETCQFLIGFKGISRVMTADDLTRNEYTWGIRSLVQKGFNVSRSGDVMMVLEPGLITYKITGSDHRSGYTYDTHVPLLFYGWKIKNGVTPDFVDITDIAPTLAQILGIQPPNGATGKVISKVLELK